MPPKVYNIDVRSVDRNYDVHPNAEDFVIDLGRDYKNVTSLKLGSLEVPNTRFSIEEQDNTCYFSEGFHIGTHEMQQAFNALKRPNGQDLTIPATLMPITSFDGTLITTAQPHGLEAFLQWSAQDETRPQSIFVGAEPGPAAKRVMRGGIMLHRIPNVTFPAPNQILLPAGIITSFRVGTRDVGFIHVPTMHLQEILSLLNHIGKGFRWTISSGKVRWRKEEAFTFPASPGRSKISLGEILGMMNNRKDQVAASIPYLRRARIPPGFYASPPSLFANSLEEAIMHRGLLTGATFFKIMQLDALFSETVTLPEGLYTPELLLQVIRSNISSDTAVELEHVDDKGVARDGWVRWTFRSTENHPFTLDFSNQNSSLAARVLGFRQRRYTGRVTYRGEAFAVPATRNISPAPIPSPIPRGPRGPVRGAIDEEFDYTRGLYTVTGTTPSQQRFALFTEPSQSFAVPNQGMSRNYFMSIPGQGTVDITTKGMPKQQSYGFRRGDVLRMTGVIEETMPVLPIVDETPQTTQIGGQTVQKGVVAVLAAQMGGMGYYREIPPTVHVLTNPTSGTAPTVTPHIHEGRIVHFSVADVGDTAVEFSTQPLLTVDEPPKWTVESAQYESAHMPERHRLRIVVNGPSITGMLPGRSVVITGSSGGQLDRAYRLVELVSETELVVEEEAMEDGALSVSSAGGALLRFGYGNCVPVTRVDKTTRKITTTEPLLEVGTGYAMLLSRVAYTSVLGICMQITVTGTVATAIHDGALTSAVLVEGKRVILRGMNDFDGVWIISSVGQNTFTFSVPEGTGDFTDGFGTIGAMECSTCANPASVFVCEVEDGGKSLTAVAIPYSNYEGIGGTAAYVPSPIPAHVTARLLDESIDRVEPSIDGFLHNAYSTSNMSSVGSPAVQFAGGETTSDVFNTRTSAEATSTVLNGSIVSATQASATLLDGEAFEIIMGRLETTGFLRLSLRQSFTTDDDAQPLTINNFYYDATYGADVWEPVPPDGLELVTGHTELRLTVLAPASLMVPIAGTNCPVRTGTLFPSTMHVSWPGQYTNSSTVAISMGVQNDVTTRVGICTAAVYETTGNFRYLIEYNNKGLNGGRGFEDAVASGTIVITFSKIFAPRTELFGQSSSAIAFRDPEMATLVQQKRLNSRSEQIVLRRLGIISDVFGNSSYLAGSQWNLEGQPYRILQFLAQDGSLLGRTSHTHVTGTDGDGRVESEIFGKLIIPSAYNTVRFQAYEVGFTTPRDLRRIRVRILAADETLYPLHGRELSLSVLLTTNPVVQ